MGHSETKLTGNGHKQAELLGEKLKFVSFKQVFISDLIRTKETYKLIDQARNKSSIETKVTLDKRLREKCGGEFECRPKSDMIEAKTKSNIDERFFKGEGGESGVDVYKRAEDFLNELISEFVDPSFAKRFVPCENHKAYSKAEDCNSELKFDLMDFDKVVQQGNLPRICIVSHNGWIRELINIVRERKGLEPVNSISFNTSLYVLRIWCLKCKGLCLNMGIECRLDYDFLIFNDIKHLNDLN